MNLKVLRRRFEEMFKDLINPKYLHIVSTINQVALKPNGKCSFRTPEFQMQ